MIPEFNAGKESTQPLMERDWIMKENEIIIAHK